MRLHHPGRGPQLLRGLQLRHDKQPRYAMAGRLVSMAALSVSPHLTRPTARPTGMQQPWASRAGWRSTAAADSSGGQTRAPSKLVRLEPTGSNANRLMNFTLPVVAMPYMVSIRRHQDLVHGRGNRKQQHRQYTAIANDQRHEQEKPGRTGQLPSTVTCRALAPEQPDLQITAAPGTLTWRNETFDDVTPVSADRLEGLRGQVGRRTVRDRG